MSYAQPSAPPERHLLDPEPHTLAYRASVEAEAQAHAEGAPGDPHAQLRAFTRAIDWQAIAPRSWYARRGRRLLDVATVSVLAPVAALPMAAVVFMNLCIFRDPRRVFFVQERVGYRGELFRIYKFRTMRDAGCGALHSWSNGSDHLRVTRFGRFLRNAHLDELPQLLNILKGEMGIIGPRPEMVEIEAWAESCVPGFMKRLRIRPGVTGWAQITQGYTGRCREAYAAKLEANERVTCRPSLRRDVEILFRTALWMLRGKGWQWKLQGKPRPSE